MSIGAITGLGASLPVGPTAKTAATAPTGTTGTGSTEASNGFGGLIGRALDGLQGTQSTADGRSVQAATGSLTDVHDFMIATTQAQLSTELTVAVRNKAVEAFKEIMGMQV